MRKPRKKPEPLLFPGYLLNERCKTIQCGACICGHVFELISSEILKAQVLSTDSTEDVCPDLMNQDFLFESKAFGSKSHRDTRCLVHGDQLEEYVKLKEPVLYVFWAYDKGYSLNKKTQIGRLVTDVSKAIKFGLVLDLQTVRTLFSYIGHVPGLGFRCARMYFQGRKVFYRNYLVISRTFFVSLIQDPPMVLKSLGLEYNNYELYTTRRRITFEYNGVKFRTNTFKFHKILPRIPF